MFERYKYKDFAKKQLQNRLVTPSLIILTIVSINILISVTLLLINPELNKITESFSTFDIQQMTTLLSQNHYKNTIILSIYLLITLILFFIFDFAQNDYFIQMTRTPEPIPYSVFLEGLKKFFRAIKCGAYICLKLFLWLLVPIACELFIYYILFKLTNNQELLQTLNPLFSLIAYVLFFYKLLQYSFTLCFASEYKFLKVRRCLNLSIIITQNHIKDLILLYLSFILWFLGSLLTRGIIDLIFKPYFKLTMINTYHALLMEKINETKISAEELNFTNTELTEEA